MTTEGDREISREASTGGIPAFMVRGTEDAISKKWKRSILKFPILRVARVERLTKAPRRK